MSFSWKPSSKIIESTHIFKMMQKHHFKNYRDFWNWSVAEKEKFWQETVANLNIGFHQSYQKILDLSHGVEQPKWLYGAKLNIVNSCFQNDEEAVAVIHQKENAPIEKVSQKKLEVLVNRIANGLKEQGVSKGDVIAIDMPMTLEAVAIYLAAIKAGNPVATVADSFTANEIKVRLDITEPQLIFTQDVIPRSGKTLPLYEKIVEAGAPKAIVVKTTDHSVTLRANDLYWDNFLSHDSHFQSSIHDPDDVITILFSSGTTGAPKAIPWTHTTPIKAASDAYYHHNIERGDVVCWPTNLGWMMGPWLIYAALINKASIALYDDAPLSRDFGAFVQNAKVTMLGVVPSIVKTWHKSQCMEGLDWSAIKCFSSTGEASSPIEMEYLMKLAGNKPVIEYCGGTEIGGGYVTSTLVQENISSTFSTQALGGEFVLLDENNNPSEKGELFLIPPIMGLSTTLLNRNHHEVYYKDTPKYKGKTLRRHGDQLERLSNGYYKAQGRVDDAMNLGGIKVSSIQIESVINKLVFVKESAAIAVSPKDGGPSELIVYYVALKDKTLNEDRLPLAAKQLKEQLNPLFKVKELIAIKELPRTASNKVMRRKLRDLYESNRY